MKDDKLKTKKKKKACGKFVSLKKKKTKTRT